MLVNLIRKIVSEIQLRKSIRNRFWRQKLKYYGLTDLSVSSCKNGDLKLETLGITLSPKYHGFMLEGFHHAKSLHQMGALFQIGQDHNVQLEILGLKVSVHSKQELFILREIYSENCYNYIFQSPSIVVDIGFNVGFTSLFFA